MKAINGAAFRTKIAEHLNECESTKVPLLVITQKRGREPQQMVIISKDKFDSMVKQLESK